MNTINIFERYNDVLNIEDLQKMLHISRVLAYSLIKNGKIKAVKIGREYKIAKVHVIEYFLGASV